MSTDIYGSDLAIGGSTTALGSGTTFTGQAFSVIGHVAVSARSAADKPGASGALVIQLSQDGVTWDSSDPATPVLDPASPNVPDPTSSTGAFVAQAWKAELTVAVRGSSYARILYTNGGGAQTTFRLQAVRHAIAPVLPRTLSALGNLQVAIAEVSGVKSLTFVDPAATGAAGKTFPVQAMVLLDSHGAIVDPMSEQKADVILRQLYRLGLIGTTLNPAPDAGRVLPSNDEQGVA